MITQGQPKKRCINTVSLENNARQEIQVKIEDQFLSFKEVMHCTQLSKSTILRMQRSGTFPKSYQVGKSRKLFSANELNQWVRDVKNDRIRFN